LIFYRRKLANIAENNDLGIDPRMKFLTSVIFVAMVCLVVLTEVARCAPEADPVADPNADPFFFGFGRGFGREGGGYGRGWGYGRRHGYGWGR
jgi:hypothetical protein